MRARSTFWPRARSSSRSSGPSNPSSRSSSASSGGRLRRSAWTPGQPQHQAHAAEHHAVQQRAHRVEADAHLLQQPPAA